MWHGPESDKVDWTVKSDPARFLDGGVEKTSVGGAFPPFWISGLRNRG
ncbi:MAG: hypothetical protein PHV28_10520 [Kiritimatiellae bacterium]|nr:hypothetical protein [Kiritimatiellia bacterium]